MQVVTRKFVDFADIKRRISLSQCVTMLGLQLKQSSNQFRGICPVHGGGERTLVVTPDKGFFCFGEKKGGDQIGLVAHVRQISNRDAAEAIALHFGIDILPESKQEKAKEPPAPQAKAERSFDPAAYAARLDPAHESLSALGISPETFKAFSAGLSSGGVNRGRLAIPLHDRQGKFIAYFGKALKGESPALIFPNGTEPQAFVFNAHRVEAGDLYLVRDPLDVLQAKEQGIDNVVAFLTEAISAQQLEQLAGLMDEKHCDSVVLY